MRSRYVFETAFLCVHEYVGFRLNAQVVAFERQRNFRFVIRAVLPAVNVYPVAVHLCRKREVLNFRLLVGSFVQPFVRHIESRRVGRRLVVEREYDHILLVGTLVCGIQHIERHTLSRPGRRTYSLFAEITRIAVGVASGTRPVAYDTLDLVRAHRSRYAVIVVVFYIEHDLTRRDAARIRERPRGIRLVSKTGFRPASHSPCVDTSVSVNVAVGKLCVVAPDKTDKTSGKRGRKSRRRRTSAHRAVCLRPQVVAEENVAVRDIAVTHIDAGNAAYRREVPVRSCGVPQTRTVVSRFGVAVEYRPLIDVDVFDSADIDARHDTVRIRIVGVLRGVERFAVSHIARAVGGGRLHRAVHGGIIDRKIGYRARIDADDESHAVYARAVISTVVILVFLVRKVARRLADIACRDGVIIAVAALRRSAVFGRRGEVDIEIVTVTVEDTDELLRADVLVDDVLFPIYVVAEYEDLIRSCVGFRARSRLEVLFEFGLVINPHYLIIRTDAVSFSDFGLGVGIVGRDLLRDLSDCVIAYLRVYHVCVQRISESIVGFAVEPYPADRRGKQRDKNQKPDGDSYFLIHFSFHISCPPWSYRIREIHP